MNELDQKLHMLSNSKFMEEQLSSAAIDKDQLIKCFELYIKSKKSGLHQQDQQNNTQTNNSTKNQSVIAEQDFELKDFSTNKDKPDKDNKQSNKEVFNVDNIPIIQKKVDFNALVEDQLAKELYAGNSNTQKKQFKYEIKPKYIDKYKLSNQPEIRRYKYYTDNFNAKKDRGENDATKKIKLIKDNSDHRVDNDKDSIPNQVIAKERIDNNGNFSKKRVKNSNDIHNNVDNNCIEDDDYLGFDRVKKVRGVIIDNKLEKKNSNNKNKDEISAFNKKNQSQAEDEIIDEEEEEILAKLLNQNTASLNETKKIKQCKTPILNKTSLTNNISTKSIGKKLNSNNEDNIKADHQDYIYYNEQKDSANNSQCDNQEEEEEVEDDRDIYELFLDENDDDDDLYLNNDVSCLEAIKANHKPIPKPSKIMSKYFKDILNQNQKQSMSISTTKQKSKPKKKELNKSNQQKQKLLLHKQNTMNELVKEKLDELTQNKTKVDKETKRISELKKEYARYMEKIRTETEEHQKKIENNQKAFEKKKEEEVNRIENERKIKLQNTNLLHNFPKKIEREKADLLKESIMRFEEESIQKDQQNRLTIERLKKQLNDFNQNKEKLLNEIKLYEEMKNKKSNQMTIQQQSKPMTEIRPNTMNDYNDDEYSKEFYREYIEKDKTVNEVIDLEFMSKYHDPKLNHQLELIQEEMTPDGQIIRMYNLKKEVIFPSGMKKEIFNDGYQITYFHNKDIKQFYPNGKEIYLFSKDNILQIKWPDGIQAFKFSNGNIEQLFPDGTKIIKYSDGTKVSLCLYLITIIDYYILKWRYDTRESTLITVNISYNCG